MIVNPQPASVSSFRRPAAPPVFFGRAAPAARLSGTVGTRTSVMPPFMNCQDRVPTTLLAAGGTLNIVGTFSLSGNVGVGPQPPATK